MLEPFHSTVRFQTGTSIRVSCVCAQWWCCASYGTSGAVCGFAFGQPSNIASIWVFSKVSLCRLFYAACLFIRFIFRARETIFGQLSLFKMHCEGKLALVDAEQANPVNLCWEGKEIHNVEELIELLYEGTMSGLHMETCMLCFEDKPSLLLSQACGKCPNLVCDDCARSWWSMVKPVEYLSVESNCVVVVCCCSHSTIVLGLYCQCDESNVSVLSSATHWTCAEQIQQTRVCHYEGGTR
jgi:hypothetical protein